MDITTPERDIYTISRLNREVRTVLESGFPMIWIQAEISNLARPASGHLYFTLKDEHAQVRCAMFRNRNMHMQHKPENGQLVLVRAKIGLYEPRGEYQLIIEHMEAAGEGALRQQFEELKQKLNKAGLFNTEHKKAFPQYPKTIGVITSPSGAAIHDILTTLQRRYPVAKVIVYPASVQGASSAAELVQAVQLADEQKYCDVLILSRGGGSLEDLWSFNDEQLAHTIYNCETPIISGVGHDVDFTIADFVADHRAPTPTGAAEYITPDRYEINKQLDNYARALTQLMQGKLTALTHMLKANSNKLVHPGKRLQDNSQRLDELSMRLQTNTLRIVQQKNQQTSNLYKRLQSQSPEQRVKYALQQIAQFRQRLQTASESKLKELNTNFKRMTATLNALSPLATLDRGYAIVIDKNNKVVQDCSTININDEVTSRISNGSFQSKVTKIDQE